MSIIRVAWQFFLIAGLSLGAIQCARSVEATPEQQQACENDAFRLCSSEIPDAGRVAACLDANEARLSAPCHAVIHAALMERSGSLKHRRHLHRIMPRGSHWHSRHHRG
jgi:Cysteine rich repeat